MPIKREIIYPIFLKIGEEEIYLNLSYSNLSVDGGSVEIGDDEGQVSFLRMSQILYNFIKCKINDKKEDIIEQIQNALINIDKQAKQE